MDKISRISGGRSIWFENSPASIILNEDFFGPTSVVSDMAAASSGSAATQAEIQGIVNMAAAASGAATGSGSMSAVGDIGGISSGSATATGTLSSAPAPASFTARPGVTMTAGVGGFFEYLPAGWNTGPKAVMISFHGIGDRGNGDSDLNNMLVRPIQKYLSERMGTAFAFPYDMIVICPQYTTPGSDIPTPTMIQGVIDYVKANYNVNRRKIFLNGISLGGGGVLEWGSTGNLLDVAAITLICPARFFDQSICDNFKAVNMPFWFFHGDADPIVPYSISTTWANGLNTDPNKIDPPVQVRTYPGEGHNVWPDATEWTYNQPNGLNIYTFSDQFERLPAEFMRATGSGSGSASAAAVAFGDMGGTSSGSSNAVGSMETTMAGSSAGSSAASAAIGGQGSVSGSSNAAGSASGQSSAIGNMSGASNGAAGSLASVAALANMAGQSSGSGSASGSFDSGAMRGSASGLSSASGTMEGLTSIAGQSQGAAGSVANMVGWTNPSGQSGGGATVQAQLAAIGAITAAVNGGATASAHIEVAGVLESTFIEEDSRVETGVAVNSLIETIVDL